MRSSTSLLSSTPPPLPPPQQHQSRRQAKGFQAVKSTVWRSIQQAVLSPTTAISGNRWWSQVAKQEGENMRQRFLCKYVETNVMSPQALEISLLGVGTRCSVSKNTGVQLSNDGRKQQKEYYCSRRPHPLSRAFEKGLVGRGKEYEQSCECEVGRPKPDAASAWPRR